LTDNAATDRLSLALASSSRSVTGVAIGEEESDTGWEHNTLLHRKALLVIATGDADNVALPFITQRVGLDFVAHALVHEDTELSVSFDLDQFRRPMGRIGDVQLHLGG